MPGKDFPVWAALEYLGAADVPHVRGSGYARMRCPFHDDSKPSAHVSEKGFVCFACGVSGDAIKLIRQQEGVDYQTAVAVLKARTGEEDRSSTPEREFGQSLLG